LFVENIQSVGSLGAAYADVHKPSLDAYLSEYIDELHRTVELYLGNLPETVRNGQNPAPGPDQELQAALNWLPKCVDFIWYSNLNIINDIKKKWLARYDPESITWLVILAKIDDTYLNDVSVEYDVNRTRPVIFQLGTPWHLHLIVDVAASLSTNDAVFSMVCSDSEFQSMNSMLENRLPEHLRYMITQRYDSNFQSVYPALVNRLRHYRHMISRIYHEMARYMEIQIPREYDAILQDITRDLDELANRVVHPITRRQWRNNFYKVAKSLSHTTLSMMAIYGRPARFVTRTGPSIHSPLQVPAAAGMEVISELLAGRWYFRRLINLQLGSNKSKIIWTKQLLSGLSRQLENEFGGGAWWIPAIRPLLDWARSMLGSGPPFFDPAGGGGQTSGTN
jgi:hypothetical protein